MAYDRERAIQARALRTRTQVEHAVERLNRDIEWLRDHGGTFVQLSLEEQQRVVIEGFVYDHRRIKDGD